MKAWRSIAFALALTLSTAACASTSGSRGETAAETPPMVEVSNNNWSDMVIYVVQADRRQRLGTVTSMSTARLRFPHALASPGSNVQLLADPVGGTGHFRTDRIRITPRQVVELTIENNLAISNYAVLTR